MLPLAYAATQSVSGWLSSPTTQAVVGIVVAVLTVAVIALGYFTWRAGPPRRVIVYRMQRPTPLVTGNLSRQNPGDVVVTFKGDR